MRPQAGELEPVVRCHLIGHGDHGPRVALPEATHPAVVLDVKARGLADGGAALGRQAHEVRAPRRKLAAGRQGDVQLGRRERPHDQDRGIGKHRAEVGPLRGGGHGQPRRAPGQCGMRALGRAMTVAVGLDHGAEPRATELGMKAFAVAFHGAEIDHGRRPPDLSVAHRRSASGIAATTSDATTDSGLPSRSAAICPARACA